MKRNLNKYLKNHIYKKINKPKTVKLGLKDIYEIIFTDKIVIRIKNNKSFKYIDFNKEDKLIIDKNEIDIQLFHDIYLETHQKSTMRYNLIHNDISFIDFHIPLYLDFRDGATAEWNYLRSNQKYKVPYKINMNINAIFNLDEYKFSLGHEFGHFTEYLNIIPLNRLQKIQRYALDSFCFIIKFSFLALFMLISTKIESKEPSFDIITNILVSLLFMTSFFLLMETVLSFLHIIIFRNDFYENHQEEFNCDKYSYDIFKDEINLKNTFLGENKSLIHYLSTYSSHPSHYNRMKFLLKNKKVLNPILITSIIVNNDKDYDDSIKIISQAFSDIKKYLIKILEKINKKGYNLIYEKANNKNN